MIVLRADKSRFGPRAVAASVCGLLLLLILSGCATRAPSPDFHRAVRDLAEDGHYLREVPFYPVSDTEEHAAVLGMVIDYWHPPGFLARLRPRWRAHRVNMIQPDGALEAYLLERNLWGYWGAGHLDDLQERLRAETPVLVTLQERPLDRTTLTLALVAGYDDPDERVVLYGLDDEPVQMSYDDFLRRWRYAYSRLVTVAPPERVRWTLSAPERVSRGRYYMALAQYDDAATDFDAALEMEPGEARHYVELADAFLLRDRYDKAEPLYRAALALDDLDARALNNLAYLLLHAGGDLREAEQLARRATALEPDNPRLLDTLGMILHRMGDYRQAARILERARTRAMQMDGETQATIALHLVQVYHDDDLWHLARQTLADALTHQPDVDVPEELRIHLRD